MKFQIHDTVSFGEIRAMMDYIGIVGFPVTVEILPDKQDDFPEAYWDKDLTKRGISIERTNRANERRFHLVDARFLDQEESGGTHHIFVEVLDQSGNRMVGQDVRFFWKDGEEIKTTENKKGELYAVDFPMFAAGYAYSVRMVEPSDTLYGFGLGGIDNPFSGEHVSYRLTFRLFE